MKLKLFEALAELADPRRLIWEHSLEESLLAAICTVGCGAENWTSVFEGHSLSCAYQYFKQLHSGHGFASRDSTANVRMNVRETKTLSARYCFSKSNTQSLNPVPLLPGGAKTFLPRAGSPSPASV